MGIILINWYYKYMYMYMYISFIGFFIAGGIIEGSEVPQAT